MFIKFSAWRRTAGCIALVLACVLSIGWLRSLNRFDSLASGLGSRSIRLESYEQKFVCGYEHVSDKRMRGSSWVPDFCTLTSRNHLEVINCSLLFDLDVREISNLDPPPNTRVIVPTTAVEFLDDEEEPFAGCVIPYTIITADCFSSGFQSSTAQAIGDFRMGTIKYDWGQVDFVTLPYWAICCPLAIVSAWLLLLRPQKPPVKALVESGQGI